MPRLDCRPSCVILIVIVILIVVFNQFLNLIFQYWRIARILSPPFSSAQCPGAQYLNLSECLTNVLPQVYVDDTLCGAISYEVGKVVYEVDCGGAVGNNIIVRQNGEYLTLCEVQAIGVSSPSQ